MKRIISIILLTVIFTGFSQAKDFKEVDRYARSVKKSGDYKQLAKKLVKPFTLKVDKARAVFVWIAHNIKYDVAKKGNNGQIKITGRSKREIERKRRNIRLKKVRKTYISGKGVCQDYSLLFVEMCKAVGLEAAYIEGYARFGPREIGKIPNTINHAWNAIKLNGKWKLVDVTWAAGTVDTNRRLFVKDFSDFFFLTKPDLFILNHLPKNSKWQLLKKKISKKRFASFPHIHASFYHYGVKNFAPHNVFISSKNKNNNTITLQLQKTKDKIGLYIGNKPLQKKYTVSETGKVNIKIPNSIRKGQSIIIGAIKNRTFLPLIEYKAT